MVHIRFEDSLDVKSYLQRKRSGKEDDEMFDQTKITYDKTSSEMLSNMCHGQSQKTFTKEWLGPEITNSDLNLFSF